MPLSARKKKCLQIKGTDTKNAIVEAKQGNVLWQVRLIYWSCEQEENK